MITSLRRAAPQGALGTSARFAIVGVIAAVVYCAVTLLLSDSGGGLSVGGASFVGFAISIAVSYFGHLRYAYRRRSDHLRYAPRFLTVACGLSVALSVAS